MFPQNVELKVGELALQLLLLVQSLEQGLPLVLIALFAATMVLNVIACALMMSFKRFQSDLLQVTVDCM